ncbi:hypothetical protein [Roseibium polysiphoniae]|uniref:Uncharacterized protein n=1 Tax=Roseibium polysiphoniae TaxID=2571221 RepID=A0ABR9CD15_9HYPH|nr:hypothetical protein [Roseibium polysiphoniae]MBD8877444.1 hypothetical protein [Roseibium polysiphoniae]
MKKISAIIIIICLIYFVVGFAAVQFSIVSNDFYLKYAGVVGGLASVIGLISFTRPGITTDDLQKIEAESLRSIAETTDKIEKLEIKRATTKDEIDSLDQRKKEMELLVKKASMSLFLKEQVDYYEKKISIHIEKNPDLKNSIENIHDAQLKLSNLNEEIDSHPNAELLHEVIESSQNKRSLVDEAVEEFPPIVRTMSQLLIEVGRSYAELIRVLVK